MAKNITVIGSGATAHAAAALFTKQFHRVTLAETPENAAALEPVLQQGGILLRGAGPAGFYTPQNVTSDISSAVSSAEIIVVSTLANRHEEIAAAIAPHVRSGQVVVISPGNAGSLIFAREWRRQNVTSDALLLELQGNLFPCRLTGKAEAFLGGGLRKKRAAAFPASRTQDAIALLDGVLDIEPARHVFETALNAPNIINHLAATVLNTSAIDKAGEDFGLFLHGLTPTVLTGLEKAWADWKRVLDVLGYWQMGSPVEHLRLVADRSTHPELNAFRSLLGPSSLSHRYVSEDAPASVSLLISLARKTNTPIPYTEGLLAIVSAINGVDYYGQGRTLENFGLAKLTLEQLDAYLTGEA